MTPSPDIIAAAQAAQTKYGILASITLAQWALESSWGAKMTGQNNCFGIKLVGPGHGTTCTTHEVVNGQSVQVQATFRDFPTIGAAFDFHAALLATAKPYTEARKVRDDYRAFAQALTGVYATDAHYGDLLIKIIETSGFAKYDGNPQYGATATQGALNA